MDADTGAGTDTGGAGTGAGADTGADAVCPRRCYAPGLVPASCAIRCLGLSK